MEEAKFYWTVVAGVIGAGWVLAVFIRDRVSQSIDRSSAIVSRVLEIDKIVIDNPDIARYLSRTALKSEQFFRSMAALDEDAFYKAKTYGYRLLNSFDEILSIASQTTTRRSLLKPPSLIELADWEVYIKMTLRHPLYQSILNNEAEIFGASIRDFWARNRAGITSTAADPFTW